MFHAVDVFDGKELDFAVLDCLNGKLTLQHALILIPIGELEAILDGRADNVDECKVITYVYVHVTCVIINWQHERTFSRHHEKYALNFITFKDNVLVLRKELWPEERAEPGQEARLLNLLKESHFYEAVLVNVHGRLHLQFVR